METIGRIKSINIKELIENEAGFSFSKNNLLEECPFCGSGKGHNHSPAFSVNVKNNYFKCFSCGSQGSTIDFVMHMNDGWTERHAIKYLEEKYLGIISVLVQNTKPLNAFQKTLFAISKYPVKKATSYI